MINYRKLATPSTILASSVTGLILTPYIYIALGALHQFKPVFSFITLPPLLLASSFLLWRLLAKPKVAERGIIMLAIEFVSWLAIVTFIIFVSPFNLLTGIHRAGAFCTFFLIASVTCLPLMVILNTSLEQRIKRLPKGVVMIVLVLVVVSAGLLTTMHHLMPQRLY